VLLVMVVSVRGDEAIQGNVNVIKSRNVQVISLRERVIHYYSRDDYDT
jgi:hypothetical protein